jgi:aryl-alcohol dehydrogenase-like predicted oxidoreductase
MQQAGKIDRLSLTNFNRRITAEIIEAGVSLSTTQVQYSLLDTRPEKGLVQLCEAHELHLLCYGTLAGGFLSDRWLGVTETRAEVSLLENRSLVKYRLMIEEAGGWDLFQSLLQTLRMIGDRHNVSIASVASRWVLEQDRVAAVIIGARNRAHLHRYAELFGFSLQKQDLEELNRVKQQMNVPPGDVFDLERDKSGPHGRIMKYNLNEE